MSSLKPITLALMLGAATVADAGGYGDRRPHPPVYVPTTPQFLATAGVTIS